VSVRPGAPRPGAARAALRRAAPAAFVLLVGAPFAAADWLAPDASFREAQLQLRYAVRDTVEKGANVSTLDTLGMALLRLGRVAEARAVLGRVLAMAPGDRTASAAFGKFALWADRLAEAESLLTAAGDVERARADLYATRLRRGDWAAAAAMAEEQGDEGRKPLLEQLATAEPMRATGERAQLLMVRPWPAPLVQVKLNGSPVLMLVDTGSPGLLIDRQAATLHGVTLLAGQRLAPWGGSRAAVRNATVRRLDLGGIRLEGVPAGVLSLHKLSIEVNPQAMAISGVIGLDVLRRFDVTFDYRKRRIELAPLGWAAGIQGTRVPFDLWGEGEVTTWGALQGGRRMAMLLATGMPGGGVGAPEVVFEEHGLKSGGMAKALRGMGEWMGGRPWAAVGVPSLTLGGMAFNRLPGWSGAMDAAELWRHGVRRDALLGPGILLKRRVTLDWTRRELVFEEN
jgi:hypothetical protein